MKNKNYLFFSKSTADSTGLLDTEISGEELGILKVFLELRMRKPQIRLTAALFCWVRTVRARAMFLRTTLI